MVDVYKLSIDILKENKKKNKKVNWMPCIHPINNRVGYTDGKVIYLYDETEQLLLVDSKPLNISHVLDNISEAINPTHVYLLGDVLELETDMYTLFIDTNCFKYVSSYDRFLVSGTKSPVYVIDNDIIVAIILPIVRRDK